MSYGNTHATDGVPDPRSEMQLARCGVRFSQGNINNETPSCPWCKRKLIDAGRLVTADEHNDAIARNMAMLRGALDRRRTT